MCFYAMRRAVTRDEAGEHWLDLVCGSLLSPHGVRSAAKGDHARLEPGEHTVDRGRSAERTVGGRTVVLLAWTVRRHDGRTLRRRVQAAGETVVRQRARAKADELLASTAPESSRLRTLAHEIAVLSPEQRAELDGLVDQLTRATRGPTR